MADTLCPVRAMDSLWFYQIILFPEPISLLCPKILETLPQPIITNSITPPSSNTSQLSLQHDQDFPLDSSQITTIPLVNCNNKDEEHEEESDNERPTRLSLAKTKARSHSSSPTSTQRSKGLYYSSSMGTLPTRAYFKSLWDLEREEVKGFMDLGFTFKKEETSLRMMSLLPGLQRLEEFKNMRKTNQFAIMDTAEAAEKDDDIIYDQEDDDEEEEEEVKKNRGIMRPYLSESWLIKRPDSPLLNLRIPRASAAADMKKHLRFWARTVASEIQQES